MKGGAESGGGGNIDIISLPHFESRLIPGIRRERIAASTILVRGNKKIRATLNATVIYFNLKLD